MNRIPILAGGAVLAAVVLCGGAVTMANAFTTATSSSQVLSISGVTTADPSATAASTSDDPTASPSPSASAEPGDDNGGVVAVKPSDPTKIDGRGCAHLGRHGADDPTDHDATDDRNGTSGHHDGENEPGHHEFLPGSGSGETGGDDGGHHDGGGHGGGGDDGSGHH